MQEEPTTLHTIWGQSDSLVIAATPVNQRDVPIIQQADHDSNIN